MKRIILIFLCVFLFMTSCTVRLSEDSAVHLTQRAALFQSADTNSYLLLGDSIAAHYGVSEKESYEYKLAQMLRADGGNWVTENWGVSGYTSQDLVTLLTQSVEEPTRREILANADLITISIGGNNIIAYLRDHGFNNFPPDSISGWLGFVKALGDKTDDMAVEYLSDLEVIIKLIRSVNPDATILVQNIHNVARDVQGELNFLGKTGRLTDIVEPVFTPLLRVINENAERLNYTVADTYHAFEESDAVRLLRREMIHPNADGHSLIADVLYKTYHRAKQSTDGK